MSHGTELNQVGRTIAPNLLRYQPGLPALVEQPESELETIEQWRERQRQARIRRSWYAGYERTEWHRQFIRGFIFTWQAMLLVFAFGLILGSLAHYGVQRYG